MERPEIVQGRNNWNGVDPRSISSRNSLGGFTRDTNNWNSCFELVANGDLSERHKPNVNYNQSLPKAQTASEAIKAENTTTTAASTSEEKKSSATNSTNSSHTHKCIFLQPRTQQHFVLDIFFPKLIFAEYLGLPLHHSTIPTADAITTIRCVCSIFRDMLPSVPVHVSVPSPRCPTFVSALKLVRRKCFKGCMCTRRKKYQNYNRIPQIWLSKGVHSTESAPGKYMYLHLPVVIRGVSKKETIIEGGFRVAGFDAFKGCCFQDLTIKNSPLHGIFSDNGMKIKLLNCHLELCKRGCIRIENTMNFLMVDCSITIYQNKTNQRQTTRSHNSLHDGAALQLANASGAFYNLIISTEPEFHCINLMTINNRDERQGRVHFFGAKTKIDSSTYDNVLKPGQQRKYATIVHAHGSVNHENLKVNGGKSHWTVLKKNSGCC